MSKLLLLILIALSAMVRAEDSQQIDFTPIKHIEAIIAAAQLNRIQLDGGDLMEVVGDESKYSLYWSGDYRHLFIRPKVEVGEIIELSLVLAGGMAQDVRFTVGDVTAQTIFINKKSTLQNFAINNNRLEPLSKQLKSEIALMLRAMIADDKGKYYVMNIGKQTNLQTGLPATNLQVTQLKTYRYQDLSGAVLKVTNNSNQLVELQEREFSHIFKATIAVNIENRSLLPKSVSRIFIITRENHAQ